ncbi:hypothetical protein WJX81_005720 [Elliptochloris bilobata]|uniref:RRM domain-containing protein n=1 Tax=Elliptochloris bilobata TaxID=381761 RepID=A0AAW1RTT2_9CHLO
MAQDMDTDTKLNTSLDDLVSKSRPSRGGGGREGGRSRDGHRGEHEGGRGQKRERNPEHANGGGALIRVARRIYVSNLSFKTTWTGLKDHFKAAGPVAFADILRESGPEGRSKGCGIVEFETAESAAEAINTLHLSELDGREVYVREDREDADLKQALGGDPSAARPKRGRSSGGPPPGYGERAPGGPRGGGPMGGAHGGGAGAGAGAADTLVVGRRVVVEGLGPSTTWKTLKDHFRAAGGVLHADVMHGGVGEVEFGTAADALRAISQFSNSSLDGRVITVRDKGERSAAPPRGGGGRRSVDMAPRTHADERPPLRNSAPREGRQVVVQGLLFSAGWQELKDLTRPFGSVARADIATGPDGRSKGWGTVLFDDPRDAQAAINELHGREFQGRTLAVKLDKFVA